MSGTIVVAGVLNAVWMPGLVVVAWGTKEREVLSRYRARVERYS